MRALITVSAVVVLGLGIGACGGERLFERKPKRDQSNGGAERIRRGDDQRRRD